jgi:flagellar L-ring protein precursor FlgH
MIRVRPVTLATVLICLAFPGVMLYAHPKPRKTSVDLRADYLHNVAQAIVPEDTQRTTGSLWTSAGPLVSGSTDYKAHSLNDLVTVVTSVQTTAAQSNSIDTSRAFSANSAITGVLGQAPAVTNPLLAANSAEALKGSGQSASNTAFSTDLSGQVIAVLPNGNLVIEAHRMIDMNNEHEEVIVRGVARPIDVSPANSIPSSALSSLEIELKGKGIISNSVRPPNFITRAILKIIGF